MNSQDKVTRKMLTDAIQVLAQETNEYKELLSQLEDDTDKIIAKPDYTIEVQLERFKKALEQMSPDDRRGNGTFEYGATWLAVIWAGASIGEVTREILREWSMRSERYTEEGFNKAFDSYKPNKPNRVTAGSLYHYLNTLSDSKEISKTSEKNQLINSNTNYTEKQQITE